MSEAEYTAGLADEIARLVAARLQVREVQLLTIEDLAARLAISTRSARTLVDGDPRRGLEPVIPSIRVGGGSRRIESSAVDAYVRSLQESD